MEPTGVVLALINKDNTKHAIEMINNRIDCAVKGMCGVDVTFRRNDNINIDVLKSIVPEYDGVVWNDEVNAVTVYESTMPLSSIINLRSTGMCKYRVVDGDGAFIADTYKPLESFVKRSDGSISFSPAQQMDNIASKHYGGNIQHAIMPYIYVPPTLNVNTNDIKNEIITKITSSGVLDINNLYYIQTSDWIANEFKVDGGQMESLTLHFE